MNTISQITPEIQVTENALNKVKLLIEGDPRNNLMFRVFITGGGCSGFQYGFCFEEMGPQEDDIQVEISGVTVLVDPLSMTYLEGSELHYTEGLYGSHFSVKNPNAQTTCGCGSSFSV
jgi:iron-sulfur cluster insertion protein